MQRQELEPIDYNQTHLINQTNLFIANSIFRDSGIKLNEKGVCGGLASQYLLFKARGKEHAFFAKLKKISQLSIHDYEKDKEHVLTLIGEICPLFNPGVYTKENVNQGDLDIIFAKKDQKYIERGFTFGAFWNVDDLNQLFKDTIFDDEMVYLSANHHAVAAFKKFNTYYLYDPNSKEGEKKFSTLADFTEYAKKCLFVKADDTSIDINIKTFRYKKKNVLTPPPIYPKKTVLAAQLSDALDPGFFYSLQETAIVDDGEVCSELLKRNADPFATKPKSIIPNYSIMQIACVYGAKEVIKAILERPIVVPENILDTCLKEALGHSNLVISNMLIDYCNRHYPNYIKSNLKSFYLSAAMGGNIECFQKIEAFDKKQIADDEITQGSAFLTIMKYGHPELLDKLLTDFPNLKKDSHLMNQGLEMAIEQGKFSVFSRLSQKLGALDSNILMSAIRHQQSKMVTQMLTNGTATNFSHVVFALEHCQMPCVKSLLQAKENHPKNDKRLFQALADMMKGDDKAGKFLLSEIKDKSFAENLLLAAIVHNERPLIRVLKTLNINLYRYNSNAGKQLALACARGDLKAAQHLLEEGIDPHQLLEVTENETTVSKDLFQLANQKSNPKLIMLLLHYNKKITPEKIDELCLYAAFRGNVDILKELNSLPGFSLKNLTFNALELAARYDNYNVVKYLLELDYDLMHKNFIIALCKKEKLDILKPLIVKYPEIRDLLTPKDVADLFIDAITQNKGKGVECLLLLKKFSEEEKTQLLTLACNEGKHNTVNALLKNKAQFKSNYREAVMHGYTYRRLLHLAFGLDINQGRLNDKVLIQHAVLYDHPDIYKFLIKINPELEKEIDNPLAAINPLPELLNAELAKQVRARKEVIDDIKHNRHHLFNYNKSETLFSACRQGKVAAVKHLVEKNKIDLGAYQDLDILLEIAATRYHMAIVSYLVPLISPEKLNQCLNTFLKSDLLIPVAAILEVIKPYDLKPELKELILTKQAQLRDIFREDIARQDLPADEAIARQERVTHEKNALGVILHAPLRMEAKPAKR